MYSIYNNLKNNILEVKNSKNIIIGKIHLNSGASLQELTLENITIIEDLSPLPYSKTYASSLLFPFANRIKDGKYSFDNKEYQLKTNLEEEKNALHGFIFDANFTLKDTIVSENSAKIVLEFNETSQQKGFPFLYNFRVTYVFTESSLDVNVNVQNTDNTTFPFTIGWHPYFKSDNLSKSDVSFSCEDSIILDDRNITTGVKKVNNNTVISIENKQLDDCWSLKNSAIKFNTPSYQLNFKSSSSINFLQLFTPPKENVIAIEPTTGVSDSFNNKIGLQTLAPKETYSINWNITLKKK